MAPHQFPKSLFGRRLREARLRKGIPQDKLGIMVGLDESCSSARMSRYENGIHSPPFDLAVQIAKKLNHPIAYFYCDDDRLAEIMRIYHDSSEKGRSAILECAAGQQVQNR